MEPLTFLFVLAIFWMVFAVVQDFKTREIANWLNFSLIVFAIGFRFFYSFFNSDFNFLYQGLIGLGIFFVLGNVFYYCRFFAGGDAKLMISLGAIIPFSNNLLTNIKGFSLFLVIFLFVGIFYTFFSSLFLSIKNHKKFSKKFKKIFLKHKKLLFFGLFLSIIFLSFSLYDLVFLYFGCFLFFVLVLFFYLKAVEESCFVNIINTKNLREGDWICNTIKVKNKEIKPTWDGLTKKEISLIRKNYDKIKIKSGIPFSPVFLISFILFIIFFKTDIINFLFNFFIVF